MFNKHKKLFNVKIYSGRDNSIVYSNLDKQRVRWLVRDIRARNRRLKRVDYPQRYTYEIKEATV